MKKSLADWCYENNRKDLLKEWNNKRNEPLTPFNVTSGTDKKVWWRCAKGHDWETRINVRTRGQGCPICSNRKILVGYNDLFTTRPDLANEWNYDKNGGLKPTDVPSGSNKKVWWKCSKGHEWQAVIESRAAGCGCPKCGNEVTSRKLSTPIKGVNDLATISPNIAAEWDYKKNAPLTPEDVRPFSKKKVWWCCSNGHEWQAVIYSRSDGNGCPVCGKDKIAKKLATPIKGVNDLATYYPKLVKEWDYKKNAPLTPKDVTSKCNRKAWWICPKGHSYDMVIGNRSQLNQGCPFCAGKRVLAGFNDLATTSPEIAEEWDYKKNYPLTPRDVSKGQAKIVWWTCKRNHSYKTRLYSKKISGCPYCARETHTSFPEQVLHYYIKQYFPDVINSDIAAIGMELDIYIPSLKTAIEYDGANWHSDKATKNRELKKNKLCNEADIILIRLREDTLEMYDDVICLRATTKYTPETLSLLISDTIKIISSSVVPDIDVLRDLSKIYKEIEFQYKNTNLLTVSPSLAKEWHPSKNGNLTPDKISFGSKMRVWWICSEGHEWLQTIPNRLNNCGCPYCGNQKVKTGYNDLCTLYPNVAAQWDYNKNGNQKPERTNPYSNKKAWWLCSNYGHSWQAVIASRTSRNGGCPYCSNKKVLVGFNDMATTNPELIQDWDYELNNGLTPKDVTAGTNKKIQWKCHVCGHKWHTTGGARLGGTGCPKCASKRIGERISKPIVGVDDLATVNPKVAAEWNYDKNNGLTPKDVKEKSGMRVWWTCQVCGHEWQASVLNRISNQTKHSSIKGNGCPMCARKRIGSKRAMPIKGVDDLATMCPELVKEWDFEKNEGLTPQDIRRGSGKSVWWICPKGHSYKSKIGNRSILHEGCPECRKEKTMLSRYKPVRCIETGEVYKCIKDAANAVGITGGSIGACLAGKSKTCGGYHWECI